MNFESRIDLAKWFKEKEFKIGAEIGVCDGRYSEILCKEIPGLKLFCVDPWLPYSDSWRGKDHQEKTYNIAKEKLKDFDTKLLRMTSLNASLLDAIPDKSLDFVYIDGSHTFDNVMLDIILWAPKVRRKGIVAGHDYCHFTNSGVIEAVNKYCEIHDIELNLIGRNMENHQDDRQPTWWFVKR